MPSFSGAYSDAEIASAVRYVEAAFGPEKYQRLRELKKQWDPRNLFHHNQNIPPAE